MLDSYEVNSDLGSKAEMGFSFDLSNFEPFFDPGRGTIELDPRQPTAAKPGSVEKVTTLAARYAAGLPLWHTADCSDHSAVNLDELDDDD